MPSQALPAQGTEVKIGSGSPLTYTAIPEIVSFSGPGGSGQVIDVTNLSSDAIEKIMGLPDEGQLSFEMNYVPENAQHAALRAARAAQSIQSIQIEFPDGTVWTFNAYVTNFTVSGGVNAPIKASITLEITGSVLES